MKNTHSQNLLFNANWFCEHHHTRTMKCWKPIRIDCWTVFPLNKSINYECCEFDERTKFILGNSIFVVCFEQISGYNNWALYQFYRLYLIAFEEWKTKQKTNGLHFKQMQYVHLRFWARVINGRMIWALKFLFIYFSCCTLIASIVCRCRSSAESTSE